MTVHALDRAATVIGTGDNISLNIIKVIESKTVIRVKHVALMGDIRKVFRILVENSWREGYRRT
jgi:hypothetical protein